MTLGGEPVLLPAVCSLASWGTRGPCWGLVFYNDLCKVVITDVFHCLEFHLIFCIIYMVKLYFTVTPTKCPSQGLGSRGEKVKQRKKKEKREGGKKKSVTEMFRSVAVASIKKFLVSSSCMHFLFYHRRAVSLSMSTDVYWYSNYWSSRKKMETLALCLTWPSSVLLKSIPTVHTVTVTVVAKVLSGGTRAN